MSLLLRWKLSPLKKLFPSLTSPFSTSIRLYAPKTRQEKLDNLKKGEELYKKFENTDALRLFASKFDGNYVAALQQYTRLSDTEKSQRRMDAWWENRRRKFLAERLPRKDRNLMNEFKEAKKKGTVDEIKMAALATDMPVKVHTPYSLYTKDMFAKQSQATGAAREHVFKTLADRWQSLSKDEKQVYNRQMTDANKDYDVKYGSWVETLSAEERELFGRKGQKYLTVAQRSALVPLTPYKAFFKDAWASKKLEGEDGAGKKRYGEIVKEIAAKWRAMSPSERKEYKSQHE